MGKKADDLDIEQDSDICDRCGAEFWGEHSCDPRLAEAIKERDEALARAEKVERDVTSLRSVCASIAILLQEAGRGQDFGPPNYALLPGAVEVYIIELQTQLAEAEKAIDEALFQTWDGNDMAVARLRAYRTKYPKDTQ